MPDVDLLASFRDARTDTSLAVLEGFHAIKHAIRFDAEFEHVVTRDADELERLVMLLAPDVRGRFNKLTTVIAPRLFTQLSPTPPDTGVIAIARRRVTTIDRIAARATAAPIVLLESPAHSGNVGAAIRAAAGAGAAAVVTTGPLDPWNPGAMRGSAGLHYALPVVHADSVAIAGRRLIAIDPGGEQLGFASVPSDSILAFGSERAGVSPELLERADARIRIPMEPGVSSLNLATAVAVVLYSWRLNRPHHH